MKLLIERSLPIDFNPQAQHFCQNAAAYFKISNHLVTAYHNELFQIELSDSNWQEHQQHILNEIFNDPFYRVFLSPQYFKPEALTNGNRWWGLEKWLQFGVTDNSGTVLQEAIQLLTGSSVQAHFGTRCWLALPSSISSAEVQGFADRFFYNHFIERLQIHDLANSQSLALLTTATPKLQTQPIKVSSIGLTQMSLAEAEKLAQTKCWAFNKNELAAIQQYALKRGRDLTDVEIEVIAQTWSEHCKHKIFNANITVTQQRHDLKVPQQIKSIFKTYIYKATEIVRSNLKTDFLKSVFVDNAGVFNVNAQWDCAVKVETHNSPSALDPYGGALTGIVGVNRDILGVGWGAEPIANVDVFCVGQLDQNNLPPSVHHPRRILEGVRQGVEHGGNKSGIPTVSGAVVFDESYAGKPLVFCGTIGRMPSSAEYCAKPVAPGDWVVMVGGRIGKDGIHGATFSSLELNESSPLSAVQLGDPFTQKRLSDFLVSAREKKLFRTLTDNGAGGLSSSVGELAQLCGKKGGVKIDVAKAATKYPGLLPYELVISESQERMTVVVAPEQLNEFLALAQTRAVECSVLGQFIDSGYFEIFYGEQAVAKIDLDFLHHGVPKLELNARIKEPVLTVGAARFGIHSELGEPFSKQSVKNQLLQLLAHPQICSRHEVVRQYDHEVQAKTFRKPYAGANLTTPNSGSCVGLDYQSTEAISIGLGINHRLAKIDAYKAAQAAVDEAVRNAICSGGDSSHMVLVDNFCWPDPIESPTNLDGPEKLGDLVLTSQALYDAAVDLAMPIVSGKDSMKNDYRDAKVKISVVPTLLMTAVAKVNNYQKIAAGFLQQPQNAIFLISALKNNFSTYGLPMFDFKVARQFYGLVSTAIQEKIILAIQDVSEGGPLVALAEMQLASNWGAELVTQAKADFFSESAASFIVEVDRNKQDLFIKQMTPFNCERWATVIDRPELRVHDQIITREELIAAYQQPLLYGSGLA